MLFHWSTNLDRRTRSDGLMAVGREGTEMRQRTTYKRKRNIAPASELSATLLLRDVARLPGSAARRRPPEDRRNLVFNILVEPAGS